MKVLIEGTPVFRERSGIGQYTYHLLSSLFILDKSNKYMIYGYLFAGKKFTPPFQPQPRNVSYNLIRYVPSKVINLVSRRLVLPPVDLLSGTKADLAIYTNFVRSPLVFGGRTITFIYDLSYIKTAAESNKKNNQLLMKEMSKTIKKSTHIITISKNSKKEIIEYYKLDPNRITIVNPAINHDEFRPRQKAEINKIKKKFGIAGKYILYTGTLEPRKNVVGILNAYSELPKKIREEYTLVLAGGRGWKDEDIYKRLNELKSENIIVTGYVADEDLPPLYSGASLFVYPSLYEGFGMPPLEAMACGVPVITSDNSSLPEVVGDAGIMIDAEDTNALTNQIGRVLNDSKLSKTMITKGYLQAKKFDWQKSAKILYKVIDNVGRS